MYGPPPIAPTERSAPDWRGCLHKNSTWQEVWRVLAQMKGLSELSVDLKMIAREGRQWECLASDKKIELLKPIMSVTSPVHFELRVPFTIDSEDCTWGSLPCTIGKTEFRREKRSGGCQIL